MKQRLFGETNDIFYRNPLTYTFKWKDTNSNSCNGIWTFIDPSHCDSNSCAYCELTDQNSYRLVKPVRALLQEATATVAVFRY